MADTARPVPAPVTNATRPATPVMMVLLFTLTSLADVQRSNPILMLQDLFREQLSAVIELIDDGYAGP